MTGNSNFRPFRKLCVAAILATTTLTGMGTVFASGQKAPDDDVSAKTIVDAVNGIMSNSWTPNKDAYDMNNDGKVNIADIVIMARTILSLGDDVVSGLESLRSLAMQVDMEVDLLSGITLASGVELNKTEIEYDGQRTEIADPKHFMPEYPGLCTLIFSIKKNEAIGEVKAENLTIMPLDYTAMEVNHIQPVDILPIIGQVEAGDKRVYQHIEHLRVAEATRIRDMMWNYGAGNYNAEEYQKLMVRLNTGMTLENPKGYDNYEAVGGDFSSEPSSHAHDERNILNTLLNHVNYKVVDPHGDLLTTIQEIIESNPNNIYIYGNSIYADVDKETYKLRNIPKEIYKSKNFLFFVAGSNIREIDGIIKNKIYHEDVNGDEHGVYGLPSSANGKNDSKTDIHLIVTIGTDSDGDIDQTNEDVESSKYPVGFHDKVLFAGRAFPYSSQSLNKIIGSTGKYATSYTNYVNVAIADLCFQMFAEVKDVDELLDMIRSSTDLRDHIRFNGEDQPLILMNPAGFFLKYLMPKELPTSISWNLTATLNKGYYHGLVFDIPGAEVKINGEWIRYNDENKDFILAQNPFTLEWRLNGDLLRKMGYKQGDTVSGSIIAIDDQYNGLSLSTEITISVTE